MLPACLHSGVLRCTHPDRMFPPNTDPADEQKADALDRWVQRQMEEAMRHLPKDLEVLPSPLLLDQMEREAAQRQRVREGCSFPPPQLRRSLPAPVPAAKPSSSSRRKNPWSAAVVKSGAVVSLPTDVKAVASNPATVLWQTLLSARLAAPLPKSSSHSPAQDSEATPEELEE
ncbi:hypothetical protein ILYODFUR_021432 [Ilyodon furcidens]|uniref:Uncharacterized protein n=1 Tax=Ilyodon furcidens TaxID=33524 RepID=A0ABV0SYW6_9TELE